MGVSNKLYKKIQQFKSDHTTSNLDLLELGDQDIIFGEHNNKKLRDIENFHFNKYISIDLHNREDVLLKDLSIIDDEFKQWDIITNFGTSEHVEPEIGHYNCWVNIHKWTKLNGFSIHEIPEVGHWKNHCRYFYNENFFNNFTSIGYEIIENSTIFYEGNGDLRFCILKKIKDVDFFDINTFNSLINIDYSINSLIIANQNNPKNLIF